MIEEECTEDYSDCWWIHACQGHKHMYRGLDLIAKYKPEGAEDVPE